MKIRHCNESLTNRIASNVAGRDSTCLVFDIKFYVKNRVTKGGQYVVFFIVKNEFPFGEFLHDNDVILVQRCIT